MSTPKLVEAFYERIWNAGDSGAAADLLADDFSFRGSLGVECKGRDAFLEYVRSIRGALANYRCEILTCVGEGDRAFAHMRFSGIHAATFRGFQPTGKAIHWLGAALFRFSGGQIAELWVLGDLAGLDALLSDNRRQATIPTLTEELALRLESLVAPEVLSPNPDRSALQVRRFGHTIASKGGQGAPADKVFCFGSRDLDHLDEILQFYRVDGLEPSFYLAPMGFTPKVAAALSHRGFVQREFQQAILYGVPSSTPPVLPSGLTIERVSRSSLHDFAQVTAEGFEWPKEWRDAAIAGVVQSFREDAYHFLARFEGKPAGVASLGIRDGVAQLNDSAVVPGQRRRGCHLALIQHRLKIAHDLGCSLVLGAANFGSASFRNQERAGLRLAYIEIGWSRGK